MSPENQLEKLESETDIMRQDLLQNLELVPCSKSSSFTRTIDQHFN